jgi:ubiquinone/menaquinone biosynthesis C-methylase UbiE
MFFQPHYVRDYRRMVRLLLDRHGTAEAMERAVGGDYENIGTRQAELLRVHGLRDDGYLVDVGCGSGRTAFALRSVGQLRYHGTDVVPELLAYAEQKAARPDWKFTLVEGLTIPDVDGVADIVAMFSVLTHLTEPESRRYVADAARVLKPGGSLIASFLDPALEPHRRASGGWLEQIVNRVRGGAVKGVTLTREQIEQWARDFALHAQFFDHQRIGQSYCVLIKQ